MSMPGFSGEASLYRSEQQYVTTSIGTANSVSPQQMPLDDGQLYYCRLACAYCSHYGLYCWYCYICAWIIVLWPRTSIE